MNPETLLTSCARGLGRGAQDAQDALAEELARWWAAEHSEPIRRLAAELAAAPAAEWEPRILDHGAHRHAWYETLAERLEAQEWAEFLWENTAFPGFIPLLERLRKAQFLDSGRAAIERNLADEHVPAPHQELMRRLMLATRTVAPAELELRSLPSNVRRTLVFYYGYHQDSWHLVGSLFATEAMAVHRIGRMGEGLRRIGLDEHDLEFITIHSTCDEHHAREWLVEVIRPSLEVRPDLRQSITTGVAACLETSILYLDDLERRFRQADTQRRRPSPCARLP